MKVKYIKKTDLIEKQDNVTIGNTYHVNNVDNDGDFWVDDNNGETYCLIKEEVEVIDEATQILDDKDKFMGALKHAYEAGQSDVNKSFNQWVFETLQSTLNDK